MLPACEDAAGGFEGGPGMHRVYREEMDGAAKNSSEPMREKPLRVASPIGLPRTRPAQGRGDDQDIEIADVVGGDHEAARQRAVARRP